MVSGCVREHSTHFYIAASLKYHAPETWHDITPSHIIPTPGRSALAITHKSDWVPSEEQLVHFLTTLVCCGPDRDRTRDLPSLERTFADWASRYHSRINWIMHLKDVGCQTELQTADLPKLLDLPNLPDLPDPDLPALPDTRPLVATQTQSLAVSSDANNTMNQEIPHKRK